MRAYRAYAIFFYFLVEVACGLVSGFAYGILKALCRFFNIFGRVAAVGPYRGFCYFLVEGVV